MRDSAIKIIIVDKDKAIRQGLGMFLNLEEDISVVGETSYFQEAVDLVLRYQPDVVVLDTGNCDLEGFLAISEILNIDPSIAVIVHKLTINAKTRYRALASGVRGIVEKEPSNHALLKEIRRVKYE